jgi:type II secretory pathway pseudopilin PulG
MNVGMHNRQRRCAMTLVELLLVVFVIAILIALLLPMMPNGHHRPAKIMLARIEMADLVNAITAYEADYNQLPFPDSATNEDVTCGISSANIQDFKKADGTGLINTNSDLIIILMDFDFGVNAGHKLNPKQIKYRNAKMVEDTNSPGVARVDYQYRDPWGNPYLISLDADLDGLVRDAFYAQPDLFANHLPTNLTNTTGIYELRGKVMVWSLGPDGKASMSVPANTGVNKDNVVSWE